MKTHSKEMVVRFTVGQRLEHLLLMVTFSMLCVTGLPQKMHEASWAASIVNALGGIAEVRFLHRCFAVVFTVQSVWHLTAVVVGVMRRRMEPTMVPGRRDLVDVWTTLKYCLGAATKPAQFGRYSFREKFEYWGVVFGAVIMIGTGVILWFPIPFTAWLPGELIPAAREMHSGEALLAFLVIVVWHLYGVHLSPIHFPGDTSIFTGRIPKDRMIEEHPLEWAAMTGEPPPEP